MAKLKKKYQYIVRTIDWDQQRLANVETLKEQIPDLKVFVDSVGDWYGTFFEACAQINDTGAVLLEDDIQLCRKFCIRAESIITGFGIDKVYNFFEKPKVWLPQKYIGGSNFLWMQCIYLPPGLPGKMKPHFEIFKKTKPHRFHGLSVDAFISYVLVQEKIKYWRIRPTLVQHLPFKSTTHHADGRQTPYFIDDLIEKGVSYDDLQPAK